MYMMVWNCQQSQQVSRLCSIFSNWDWVLHGSLNHSQWPGECNAVIGQAWVPCPPPESGREWIPTALSLSVERAGPIRVSWGNFSLKGVMMLGGKNSHRSLQAPFRAVIPGVKQLPHRLGTNTSNVYQVHRDPAWPVSLAEFWMIQTDIASHDSGTEIWLRTRADFSAF